ncbi:MAG: hypothetical protein D6734_06250 [Candidatus Schekmanbacteria bacterium]|nr:MAG: hypothetical protein D6734_06250 [Candidatus Schekmanbacteria bacterium]
MKKNSIKIFLSILVLYIFFPSFAIGGKSYFSLKDKKIIFEAGTITDTAIINAKKIKKMKAKGVKPQSGKVFDSTDLPSIEMSLTPLTKKKKRLKIIFSFLLEKDKNRLKGKIYNVKLRIKKNGKPKIIVPLDEGIERSVFYRIKSPSLREKGIKESHSWIANDSSGPLLTDGAGTLIFNTELFKDNIINHINKSFNTNISEPHLSGIFNITISILGTNFAIETNSGSFKKVKIFKGKIEIQ